MSLATEYDKWHAKVYETNPEHPDETSPWYRLLMEFMPSVKGKKILEIACGRGGFSRLLGSKGASVCGADFSTSAIEIANQKLHRNPELANRVSFVQADAQDMPFVENSFDIIVSCETIEHVPDPQKALREMYRVCRPGGTLYLTTPNYLNFMGLYQAYAALRHPGLKSAQPLDERFYFPQIRRYVKDAGWKIARSDGTIHQFPFVPRRDPIQMSLLECNHLIRRLLSPFAYHYFLIARKDGVEGIPAKTGDVG